MKNIENFYNKNIDNYKASFRKNGWGSKKTQIKRFEIFSQIGDLRNKKILDLGCGTGDLKFFLKNKNIFYTGIENNDKMIELLKSKKIHYIKKSIFSLKDIKTNSYDYVFSSGSINLPVKHQKEKIIKLFKEMYRTCKVGFAINFLSNRGNEINQNEYYLDPLEVLRCCFKITTRVILRHDYLPHDFTIIVYKK
jgi:ubiquinone/menaquinone biosynthesis C-methylase UbiE